LHKANVSTAKILKIKNKKKKQCQTRLTEEKTQKKSHINNVSIAFFCSKKIIEKKEKPKKNSPI